MDRLGIEEDLDLTAAIVGDGDDVTIAAALATAPQRPQRRHCCISSLWTLLNGSRNRVRGGFVW